jgi:hypothetical protein
MNPRKLVFGVMNGTIALGLEWQVLRRSPQRMLGIRRRRHFRWSRELGGRRLLLERMDGIHVRQAGAAVAPSGLFGMQQAGQELSFGELLRRYRIKTATTCTRHALSFCHRRLNNWMYV